MHLQRKAWRHFVLAAALVSFALPLAGPLTASPANAQVGSAQPFSIGKAFPTACTPSTAISTSGAAGTTSTDCYVEVVEPGASFVSNSESSFNMIGSEHTFTFICDALVSTLTGTPNLPPSGAGCYNVSFSVQDITTGSQSPVVQATCGNVAAPNSGDCSGASSPICPVGTGPSPAQGTTTPCLATNNTFPGVAGYTPFNTATVTINPGANHEYRATFTGYIPSFPTPPGAQPSCPTGTTPAPGVVLSTSTGTGTAPGSFSTTPGGACRFSVSADKKYIEVTNITLTGSCAGGTLFFAEGLKAFFGPSCATDAIVTGTIVVKTNVNCTNGTEPATGTAATNYPSQPEGASATSVPPQAEYSCVGDTLSVVNAFLGGVKIDYKTTGPGSFNVLNTLGTSCAGVAGATTLTSTSEEADIGGTEAGTESDATLCPTGPGSGSISACLSQPLPNNQPLVCSNTITFSFTQNARRVVPQVRWAGEKIALTKCFGPALADNTVEFVLKGNAGGLNATLLPVDLGSTIQNGPGVFPTQNTIWTITDQAGCATVIGFADGEGQMLVDAAIYADNGAGFAVGSPLINEHVFEVFYLKFDHLDLENINPATTYSTVSALAPYQSWIAGSVDVLGATTFPTSFTLPSAPGANNEVAGPTGFAVPLCQTQYIRAMVHGYFEIAGDPSGRPATSVAIPGSPLTNGGTASAGSYVLPAGRWVLPEDWPVLATFAGFGLPGQPGDFSPASVLAWDLNSGWVFNPSGENPVFCPPGLGVFAAPSLEAGTIPVATTSAGGDVNVGPCSSKDGNGTVYESAPDPTICNANASTGLTVGFSGFDPNQACTNPFPLTYTPSGATLIGGITGTVYSCPTGVPAPCLIPNGPNSTYLPNATLNQWDAPMPPAQISFGITSGPGFLQQVNKTGLYSISFDLGAAASDDTCSATGYAENDNTETCQLVIEPDPFYASAIPSSPLIPPITNNGGYLFNSWNFAAGSVTTTTGAGFVPGQSTSVGGEEGGTNVTPCTSSAASGDSVVVADGTGFMPGMSVEVYRDSDGVTIAGRFVSAPFVASTITITNVLPASVAGYPNAKVLVFATGSLAGVCSAATPVDTLVFIAEQFGLPVPSAAAFSVGSSLSLGSFAGTSIGFAPIVAIDPAANIIYIDTTAGVAAVFGPCSGSGSGLSRSGGPAGNTLCEPNLLVPAGTLVETGPVAAGGLASTQVGPPPNLYPFWQWVSTPQASGSVTNTAATVYSDNHGESVVALGTGIATQINPVAATTGGALACPSPYLPLFVNGVIITCQLPLQLLGPAGFSNVTAALNAFSASKPGCIQTFPTGTFAAVATPSNGQVIGATGPTAGQICINNLGGIEFGATATLGSTTVQAQADYPYFRGEHAPIGSAPLTKVFTSAFAKTLTVSAGTPAPAGTTSYVVTITAKDVCGNPLFGEPVQVYALGNAGAAVLAPVSGGTVISANTTSAVLTVDPTTGQAVLSLEILNTAIGTQGLVVKAVFPFERIERFVTVIPGTTPGQVQNVPYAPGWNQVGGPAGSNFSVAEALFSYDATAGQYINAAASAGALSSAAPACTGYWAYFAAPMVVAIPVTSKSGDTAACTLKAGWNLVGNPFGTAASIPSGLTAYHWNGTSYDVVGQIPVGGSVWIFNDGTHNAVTLTAT